MTLDYKFKKDIRDGLLNADNPSTSNPFATHQDLLANSVLTKEPTGIDNTNRLNTSLSFDDGTRTFTISAISGTFDYWIQGTKYTLSTTSIILPNASDMYLIFLDNTGNLGYATSFDDSILNAKAFVATVYWNATNSSSYNIVVDERHGLTMDWATHQHLHNSLGTRYYRGFNISYSTLLGDGSLDTHAEIALQGGVIADEDLITTIVDDSTPTNYFEQELSPIAKIPTMVKLNSDEWERNSAINAPLFIDTLVPTYNSSNTLSDVTNGNYVAIWVFAVPILNNPVVAIVGTREDTSLSDAQNNNDYGSINFGDMPFQEFKILYRLIYQVNSSYANSYKAALRDVQDLRFAIDSGLNTQSASPVSNHGSLTGLNNDDHPQYFNSARGDNRYNRVGLITEDFLSGITGEQLAFNSSSAGGGSVNTFQSADIIELNDPVTTNTKQRTGTINLTLGTGNNARIAVSGNVVGFYFFSLKSKWYFDFDLVVGGSIVNFATDAVLIIAGGIAGGIGGLPTDAIYFRPPRVGESAFLRFVIRQGGVETITVTSIPFTYSIPIGYMKVGFYFDGTVGSSGALTVYARDYNTTYSTTINNFLGTYPIFNSTLQVSMCGMFRTGNGAPAINRTLTVDKFSRWIPNSLTFLP